MRLHPVKASEWITFTKNNQELLKLAGAVPTNDVYMPMWGNDADITLLYGGRGGGKNSTMN